MALDDHPRIGFAEKGQGTRLHSPHRLMPIVFVPGLMGTRLSDGSKLAWNPMGKPLGKCPGSFAADVARLGRPTALEPDEKNHFKKQSERDEVANIRNFTHIVGGFYADLVKRLAGVTGDEFDHYAVRPVVYCAGYDWRQDNARSALRLAKVVDQALRETRAPQVIIVAHSMGGLVARYYCRMLGGESKVHQLILLASPSLGTPLAYYQLKHGLEGINYGDLLRNTAKGAMTGGAGAIRAAATEGINAATGLVGLAAGAQAGDVLGKLYVAFCLGAGKLLSRAETRALLRSMPSVYQLAPSQTYSALHKHWLVFDPLATGYTPTGFMLILPNLTESLREGVAWTAGQLSSNAEKAGADAKKTFDDVVGGKSRERTSPRAWRNAQTLVDFLVEFAEDWASVDDADTEVDAALLTKLHDKPRKIWDRLESTFLDCGDAAKVYRDIHTGLLDITELRAVSSIGIGLALRFHSALAVDEGKPSKTSAAGLVSALVMGIPNLARGRPFMPTEERKPKVYMHPSTVNVSGGGHPVQESAILVVVEVVSKDDHNEVAAEMFQLPPTMDGDGTVAISSCKPPADVLATDFTARHDLPGKTHNDVPSVADAIDLVVRLVREAVPTFVTGRTPPPPEPSAPTSAAGADESSSHAETPAPPAGH
jgi:pimeloyl-ACP methyl ester carboxylesterase